MKVLLTFLAVPVIFLATASADWVVETKIESPQMNSDTTTKIKGDKMRVDIPNGPAGAMSSIVDTKTGESVQLMHAQKMAVKMSGDAMKKVMDAARQKAGASAPPELKASGQSEKVGNLNCDIYTWNDGATSVKLWMAKDHPQAAALKAFEKQLRSGLFSGARMGPDTTTLVGPVIKTETTTQESKITSTITGIKEENVDAKEFEVPAGYQNMALPGAPGGN